VTLVYVPADTPVLASVAANDPVPLPVTSPVSVIVWSPVFVPLDVPENVPLCVARVPRPVICEVDIDAAVVNAPAVVVTTISPLVEPIAPAFVMLPWA
jgi:hypothetical protein